MTRDADSGDPCPPGEPTDDPIEDAVARYVDELTAGLAVDPMQVLIENPGIGHAVLERLEGFVRLDATDQAPPPLKALGDYTLRRAIGRGGMGVVYDAWQRSMDRRVALKVLPVGVAADERAFQRFLREARTAGKLDHPNIVHVHGLGIEEQTPYYAMEYVDGETLAQVLDRLRAAEGAGEDRKILLQGASTILPRPGALPRPIAEEDCAAPTGVPDALGRRKDSSEADELDVRYFAGLAEAFVGAAEGLHHAHSRAIIHRDIKPSNLMLDGAGRLRILDFGLARLEGQEGLTVSGDFLGTPLYMSPEQARRRKVPLDHRTDIYSLGATLYEMLTWRPPFLGKDHQDTLSRIIDRDPTQPRKINPRIPRDLETITLKCLAKEPGARYGTAEALAQDLRRFVRGDPIEARPQSDWARLLRSLQRQKWKAVGAFLVLLLLVASGLLLQSRRREAEERSEETYRVMVLQALGKIELGRSRKEGRLSLHVGPATGTFASVQLTGTQFEQGWTDHMEKVVDQLDRAVAICPARPEGYYLRARGIILLGRDEDARRELMAALRADPAFDPATALLESIAPAGDGSPPAPEHDSRAGPRSERIDLWREARDASREDRWGDAIAAYGKLIDLESRSARSHAVLLELLLGRGKAQLQAGEYDGALEDFTASSTLWPEIIEPAVLAAKTYLLKKRPEVAEGRFMALYASAGSTDDAACAIEDVYRELEEWQGALDWCDRIRDAALREQKRAFLFLKWRRWEEAAAAAASCLEVEPKNEGALWIRARALQEMGDLHGAIAGFSEVLGLRPETSGIIHCFRGLARYEANDIQGALVDAEQAMRIGPSAGAYNLRGLVRFHVGDVEGALADSNEELKLDPRSAAAYYNRAHFRRSMGDIDGARADVKEALRHDSLNWLIRMRRGIDLQEEGDWEGATAEFGEAIGIDPRNPEGYKNRARALLRCGRPHDALADCEKAMALAPDDPVDLYLLANFHWRSSALMAGEDAGGRGGPPELLDRAVELLGQAAGKGFKDFHRLRSECSVDSFWRHPGLRVLLSDLSEKDGGRNLDLLECLARSHARSNDLRQAVLTLERAGPLPELATQHWELAEYRKRLLPDLPSYASVDAAFDSGEVIPLLPEGAVWRFFRGRTEPSAGMEWTERGFDDRSWEEGPSGFGYGDDDDATLLEDMQGNYATVYLRRSFEVDDPGRFAKLILSVHADDGFVAYLNGREMGRERVGVPGERVPFEGLARDSPEPVVATEIEVDPASLLSVENVLAIQGVNVNLSSSDLSLTPVLLGIPRAYDPGRHVELLEAFRAVATGDDAPLRLRYLEARILERSGKLLEAAEAYEGVLAQEGAMPEPHLRLARCLLSAGRNLEAEARLRESIAACPKGGGPLFDLWVEVCLGRLGWTLAQAVDALPDGGCRGEDRKEDLRWLLEQWNAGGPIRINCGGGEYASASGVVWGNDRFSVAGEPYEAAVSPKQGGHVILRIAGTEDGPMYRTGRAFFHRPGFGAYRIPLPRGAYLVRLHTAEVISPFPGNNIFDVRLEGKNVLAGFEPLRAGFATAQVKSFEVEVADGALDLELPPSRGRAAVQGLEIEAVRSR